MRVYKTRVGPAVPSTFPQILQLHFLKEKLKLHPQSPVSKELE
jgi:hypothetical protein